VLEPVRTHNINALEAELAFVSDSSWVLRVERWVLRVGFGFKTDTQIGRLHVPVGEPAPLVEWIDHKVCAPSAAFAALVVGKNVQRARLVRRREHLRSPRRG